MQKLNMTLQSAIRSMTAGLSVLVAASCQMPGSNARQIETLTPLIEGQEAGAWIMESVNGTANQELFLVFEGGATSQTLYMPHGSGTYHIEGNNLQFEATTAEDRRGWIKLEISSDQVKRKQTKKLVAAIHEHEPITIVMPSANELVLASRLCDCRAVFRRVAVPSPWNVSD